MRRALCALGAIALALAAAPHSAGGAQKLRITMPVAALSMTLVYVAKSRGFFAEEGLDVEVTDALHPFLGRTDRALLLAGVQATLPALSPDGVTSERLLQATQEVLRQAGVLKTSIPYADFVTNEFLPR